MKKILSLVLLVLFSQFVQAGSSPGGQVEFILVHSGDVVMFSVGEHINKPECSTVGNEWALSLTTEKGRAMYAMLMASAAQRLPVSVMGENACNAWGDRESPYYMVIDYRN